MPPEDNEPKFRTISVKMPSQTIETRLLKETVNVNERTAEMVFTTEKPVRAYRWKGWDIEEFNEILSMDPKHMRSSRLDKGAVPLLNSHRRYDLKDQLGTVLSGSFVGKEMRGKVKFSKRKDAQEIFDDVVEGIISNGSVGYKVYKYQDETKDDDKIKTLRAVDWELLEMSLVPVGADEGAGTFNGKRAEGQELEFHECEIIVRAEAATNPEQTTQNTKENLEEPKTVQEKGEKGMPPEVDTKPPVDVEAVRKAAVDAERARISEIKMAVRAAKLSEKEESEFVDSGKSADEVRKLIFETLAKRDQETASLPQVRVDSGNGQHEDQRREAITEALLHRVDPVKFQLNKGRDFVGMSLLEMARACLEGRGINTRGLTRHLIAERALNSSSDFPNILVNVANKSLLRSYEEAPRTYLPIVNEVEVADFKTISRNRFGEASDLKKVNEGGGVTRGTISEEAESYKVETYAKIFGITRKAIVNDDMNAFSSLPAKFGAASARLLNALVWDIFNSNPVMGDGTALFHADHGNLPTSNATLDNTTLGLLIQALESQVGVDKKKLGFIAKYLIVPTERKAAAKRVLAEITATKAADVNLYTDLELIVSPFLSAAPYYVAGDKAQSDIIEIAYLEGQRGPILTERIGFDVEGMELKASFDVGAKALDWRNLAKNAGT